MTQEKPASDLQTQVPVAFGTLVLIICGIAVAVLASKSLSADDYVNYSAFMSVSGVFVLGVGAAIEQETNLVFFRSNGNSAATWRFMVPRVLIVVVVLWLLFLVPIVSWQNNLFANISTEVQLAVSIGAPGLLIAGIAKGIANGRGDFRRLALSHVIFGMGTILFPLIIWSFGISLLVSLVIGQAVAWSIPILILFRGSLFMKTEITHRMSITSHLSGWLILANTALLANLLSSQLIFRLHSLMLSSKVVAEAQILITVSCLASTFALALMPQIIANHRRSSGEDNRRQLLLKRSALCIAGCLALGAALLRGVISQVLLPRESTISFLDALLVTTPALFLVWTLLISGKLIAREKVKQVAAGWIIGLLSLWIFPVVLGGQTIRSLSVALFIGAAMAPTTFITIEYLQQRHPKQL